MQNIKAGGMPTWSGDRDEMHHAVVSTGFGHRSHPKSRGLIESAVASDAAGEDAAAGNVIVLDDVTPCYERVHAALRDCDAGLSVALRLLQGLVTPGEAAPTRPQISVRTVDPPRGPPRFRPSWRPCRTRRHGASWRSCP